MCIAQERWNEYVFSFQLDVKSFGPKSRIVRFLKFKKLNFSFSSPFENRINQNLNISGELSVIEVSWSWLVKNYRCENRRKKISNTYEKKLTRAMDQKILSSMLSAIWNWHHRSMKVHEITKFAPTNRLNKNCLVQARASPRKKEKKEF